MSDDQAILLKLLDQIAVRVDTSVSHVNKTLSVVQDHVDKTLGVVQGEIKGLRESRHEQDQRLQAVVSMSEKVEMRAEEARRAANVAATALEKTAQESRRATDLAATVLETTAKEFERSVALLGVLDAKVAAHGEWQKGHSEKHGHEGSKPDPLTANGVVMLRHYPKAILAVVGTYSAGIIVLTLALCLLLGPAEGLNYVLDRFLPASAGGTRAPGAGGSTP